MADTTILPPPRRKRVWLRAIGWTLGIVVVLLIAAYFVLASSSIFQNVILRQVSRSLNADVTVSDASIHPFQQVVLHNLKVQARGQEPLLTATEVRARYHLLDIIRGRIHVDEVALVSPTVLLVENPDGSSNLDPLTSNRKATGKTKGPSRLVQLDVQNVTLSNATVRTIKLYPDGRRDVTELANLNITLNHLKNGQAGRLELAADIRSENNPPAPASPGQLEASARGSFDFTLTGNLKPASVQGGLEFNITRAEGSLSELAGLRSDLKCDVTPTDINQLALQFRQGNAMLGELRASGPFDVATSEGRLKIDLLSLDKRVLNLLGAGSGIDFGTTTINSTNEIQLANAGSQITAAGRFDADKVQLTRTSETTPTLDLHADYIVAINRADRSALLHALSVNGTQNGRPLLKAELTSPMNFSWGNSSNVAGDSSLVVTLTDLNLGDWKPFLGGAVSGGNVNLTSHLTSRQSGRELAFDLDSSIADLEARIGSNRISQAGATLQARGQATNLQQFQLAEYRLTVAQQNQAALSLSGSGTYDTTKTNADMQVLVQASLAKLFNLLGRDDVTASSGTAELKGRITQQQKIQTLTGNLSIADLTGHFGKGEFDRFGTTIDLDLIRSPEQLEVRKAVGELTQSGNRGGHFDISGAYGFADKPTQLSARISDFNQTGLRPFLEPLLAGKKLVSITIDGNVSAQYNPNGQSTTKADLQVANLVVQDPQQPSPAAPLEAKLQLDAIRQKQTADVRQLQLTLTPTAQAKNQLQFTGKIDFTDTNAIQGSLKLAADSLDVTRYYDLFANDQKAAAQNGSGPASTAPAAAKPSSVKEPPAMKLPFRNFSIDASIGRMYLREVAVTNLQTTVKIDGGRVLLNPFQMALNGAPMDARADLDLSVPGYKYDLSFNANKVPVAPLVNTFSPERKGQLGGTVTAHGKINGIGTTGASLQRTLAGNFDIDTTNLNLNVNQLRSPLVRALVDVVASVPNLIRNPENALSSLLSGATQSIIGGGHGGLGDDLSKSPIDVIAAQGTAGSGRVDLQSAVVRSRAFEASARGTITLAPELTNSAIQLPVSIALGRDVVARAGFTSTDTNAVYVRLPDFLTMQGTVGQPKKDINKTALLSIATGLGRGNSGTNANGGGLFKNLGGILSGNSEGTTNAPANTNQPPSKKESPVNNLLNDLLHPKK